MLKSDYNNTVLASISLPESRVFVAKCSEQLVMLENGTGRVLKLRCVESFYSITVNSPEG